jgi:carbon-monoxide dehydrogenase large subunit
VRSCVEQEREVAVNARFGSHFERRAKLWIECGAKLGVERRAKPRIEVGAARIGGLARFSIIVVLQREVFLMSSAPFELPFEKHSVGQSVSRTEDPRLLRGNGQYSGDVDRPGQLFAYVLRSPYAHGDITRLDVSAAVAAPGVCQVVVAADLDALGIGHLPCGAGHKSRDGTPLIKPERPSLARNRIRYSGEAVAVVVAQSLSQARDASELIVLDVEVRDAVTDAREALADGAPVLHDEAPGNMALDWEFGDEKAVDDIFANAHHVTRLTLRNNRVVVAAMEPRAIVAEYEPDTERYVMHTQSQGVFGLRNGMARVMGVEPKFMHIHTYDVGGSFGMKGAPYPEYAPILLASKMLGRPIKWTDERSDSFLSDQHGRDSWAETALALDEHGKILGARVVSYSNLGAYLTGVGPNMQCGNVQKNFPSVYRLPAFHVRTLASFTNTTPIGAYRGAGRPEGVYYMERLLDTAARELGIDRVELRRRNLITFAEIPYPAVSTMVYDSGDFPAVLDQGLELADWEGFGARQAASAARGKLRGLGLACYLEVTGPPGQEMGGIEFLPDGDVRIISGTLNYGQGHAVTFSQIVSDKLGIPLERISLVQGDSDLLLAGGGTGGSKSVIAGGEAFLKAADEVIKNGLPLAAELLEAAQSDIVFERGAFTIAGTDRSVDIMALAAQSRVTVEAQAACSLDAALVIETPASAFPNGCHVAEVEIDPDTGTVDIARYAVVDDFGTLINPMLVEGQVHGGIAQGVGQALMENALYDEDGQLVTGSYMDYQLPRADEMPTFEFGSHPVPAQTNSLGAKGCGEAGTTGSLPAVMNAVVDALHRECGLSHIDMPATPEAVWRALSGE